MVNRITGYIDVPGRRGDIACPACGPRLRLTSPGAPEQYGEDALAEARRARSVPASAFRALDFGESL